MNLWSSTVAFLIWSNYDIKFILSNVKTLALIYYITSYTTKRDYSQYQRIMAATIIKKAFADQDKPNPKTPFYSPNLDKFLLKAFNRLLRNCKVSGLLVEKFLLDLKVYYTCNALIKSINISMLKTKFSLLISRQNINTINDIAYINNSKIRLYFMFEHYFYSGLCFLQLFLYKYYRVVSVIKHDCKQEGD